MLAMVFAAIALACCAVSWWNWYRVKKAGKEIQEARESMETFREFLEWGTETRIVVRNRLTHEDAYNATVFQLYTKFKYGNVFRNATMLHQQDDMKVYAAGKAED